MVDITDVDQLTKRVFSTHGSHVSGVEIVDGNLDFQLTAGTTQGVSNLRDVYIRDGLVAAGFHARTTFDPPAYGALTDPTVTISPQHGLMLRYQQDATHQTGVAIWQNVFFLVPFINIGVWRSTLAGGSFQVRNYPGWPEPLGLNFPYHVEARLTGNIVEVRQWEVGDDVPPWDDPVLARKINLDTDAGDSVAIPTPTGVGSAGLIAAHLGLDDRSVVRYPLAGTYFEQYPASPPAPAVRRARWAVEVVSAAGVSRGYVPARGISLAYDLNGPATLTTSLNGRHPITAEYVEELTHDLVVYRDGVRMFRGRIAGEPTHEIDENTHTINATAIDYRGLLDRRIIWPTSTLGYTTKDQSDIAWDLIQDTQALPGGNWGISRGLGVFTGVNRDRAYTAGKKIGEAIKELGEVIDGFEWEVDAELAFNLFYPTRGHERSFKFHYGTNIRRITRTTQTTAYTNALRYSGDDVIAPITRVAADIASRVEGRWETNFGDPDVSQSATLAEKADGALAEGSAVLPTYSVTIRRGYWAGMHELWLGDQCRLELRSGGLDVATDIRVVGAAITVGLSNDETVTMTLGRPPLNWLEFWRGSMRRLDNLERR